MKRIFALSITIGLLMSATPAYSDESESSQEVLLVDESVLDGVDKIKDREAQPDKIASEADYFANMIKVRERGPSQANAD